MQDHPDLEPGFRPAPNDLDAFFESLPEFEAGVDLDDFTRAERFVRYHLEQEVALQAWGDAGEFEQLRRYDRQLGRALELLSGVQSPAALLATVEDAEPDPAPGA